MKKILALILAAAFVLALAGCGAGQGESITVMSHQEYIDAAIDSQVTVETYVQAKQSWWEGKATLYTQSEDGAYFIYQMPCTKEEYEALTAGTKIRVTGKKSEWSGEIEITEAAFEVLDGQFVAAPFDVTSLIGTDELSAHQNEMVEFKQITVEPKADANGNEVAFLYNWDGSGNEGDDLYFTGSVDGKTVNFTVESYLCGPDTDVYKAVKALKVGDVIDLTGFLYWYDGANPHITSVTAAE